MDPHRPQDRYRVFGGIASFQILAWFRRGMFYSFLSIYLRHYLGLTVTETTLFATLPMILNIVFQTAVWGPFSDKRQLRRTLIIWGELLAGIGTVLVWHIHRVVEHPRQAGYVIIVGLALIEILWSMSNVGWSALIADLYPQKDRNTVQGRLASIGGIGRIAGVWIGGLLYDGLQLQYAGWGFQEGALFFVASGAMLISILPLLMLPEGGVQAKPPGTSHDADHRPLAAAVPPFKLFLAALVFINFGRNSIAVILSQYLVLESGLGVSSQMLSHIVNTQSVAMIVCGFGAGWLGHRLGDAQALMVGTIVATAALLLLAATEHLTLIYVASFLRGLSEVIITAASYALAALLIPPQERARRFAQYNATFFLSWGLAGTLIAGPIIDGLMARGAAEAWAYRMSFVAAAAITLAGLLLLLLLVLVYLPRWRPSLDRHKHI